MRNAERTRESVDLLARSSFGPLHRLDSGISTARRNTSRAARQPSLSSLSASWWALGRHEEAFTLNREVHADHLEALGPLHPFTAQSATSLAEDLRRTGDVGGARALIDAALPVFTTAYGPDDLLVLLAAHVQCTIMLALGESAPESVEDVLLRRRRALGHHHLDVLRTWSVWVASLAAAGLNERAAQERSQLNACLQEHVANRR